MRDQEVPTLRQFKVPVVLVVGASEELLGLVSDVAITAQVLVSESSAEDVTDNAASMRPLVLVMPEEVYAQDEQNFEALARDVRAKILPVASPLPSAADFEPELTRAMHEAEAQRPSWTGELGPS